jgi:hypothetical protein
LIKPRKSLILPTLSVELHFKQEFEELLIKEKLLWKNKSRKTWLTCKDLNTRFFHTSTLIRRRRNVVDLLKTSPGS